MERTAQRLSRSRRPPAQVATGTRDVLRDEEPLLERARLGQRDALDELLRRYAPRVYRFGLKLCGDAEDAADIVQETMLAVVRAIGRFRGGSAFSTWLYAIARRACLRRRRRRPRDATQHESLEAIPTAELAGPVDPRPDPEERATRRELRAALAAAIAALDRGQREVLVLRDIEGLSAPEVARVVGLSVQAVKSRLHRARLAVRRRMAPLLGVSAEPPRRRAGCPDVARRLSQYLEGDLAPAVCAHLEAHVARCPACRTTCASLQRTLALCRATPAPPVPPAVRRAIRAALRQCLATPQWDQAAGPPRSRSRPTRQAPSTAR